MNNKKLFLIYFIFLFFFPTKVNSSCNFRTADYINDLKIPKEIKEIKQKYQKKIITAFTIKSESDLTSYKLYSDVTDIYLFDSKGYEKSQSFDHDLIKNIKLNKELMIAGNIQYNDDLENYKNLADFIDLSGGVETSGLKDLSKIEFFLKKVNEIKNEA